MSDADETARTEAELRYPESEYAARGVVRALRIAFRAGARWQRAAQAQQEQSAGYEVVTDAEGERIIRPKRPQSIEVTNATDTVAVYWYDCDCEYLTKFCDENHRRTALVPRSVLRAMEDLNP